jgi:hypothetical protein
VAAPEILRSMRLLQDPAEDTGTNLGVGLLVGVCVAVAVAVGWGFVRHFRYWANRARSAKVLDEIEMEFVNDDADDAFADDDMDPVFSSPGGRCVLERCLTA